MSTQGVSKIIKWKSNDNGNLFLELVNDRATTTGNILEVPKNLNNTSQITKDLNGESTKNESLSDSDSDFTTIIFLIFLIVVACCSLEHLTFYKNVIQFSTNSAIALIEQ